MNIFRIIGAICCLITGFKYLVLSFKCKHDETQKEAQFMTASASMICLAILLSTDL